MQSRTRFFGIIFLALMSCQQPEKTNEQSSIKSRSTESTNPEANDGGQMTPTVSKQSDEKQYSLDQMYNSYISEELLSYLDKSHPTWSVPNQNLWYPQLFDKYKTSNSLVNYVQGDFDCNGKTDYALIVDKGKNVLGAVAFLRFNDGYKTVELTELGNPGEKIAFRLKLYKAGHYDIADPDLDPSDPKFVNLKCSGVGIGHFKELYEGGDDVYYWEKGELRSCVIEK
jgi:hypothetical protein